jgi:hypothetical protein
MRLPIRFLVFLVVTMAGISPAGAADVGVSIGLPGFYGHIDLGGAPPPQVIYNQPVVIDRGPSYVQDPVYLRVPPGRERNWRRYCRIYDACNRPVYFVRDDWYRNVYAPHYRESHAHDDRRGPGPGFDGRRDDRRDDRGPQHDDRDRDRGGDRGHDERGGRN